MAPRGSLATQEKENTDLRSFALIASVLLLITNLDRWSRFCRDGNCIRRALRSSVRPGRLTCAERRWNGATDPITSCRHCRCRKRKLLNDPATRRLRSVSAVVSAPEPFRGSARQRDGQSFRPLCGRNGSGPRTTGSGRRCRHRPAGRTAPDWRRAGRSPRRFLPYRRRWPRRRRGRASNGLVPPAKVRRATGVTRIGRIPCCGERHQGNA